MYRLNQKAAVALLPFVSKDETRSMCRVVVTGEGEATYLAATDGHRAAVLFLAGYAQEAARVLAVQRAPDKTVAHQKALRELHEAHAKERATWAFPAHERFLYALNRRAPDARGWSRAVWTAACKAVGAAGALVVSAEQLDGVNARGENVGTWKAEPAEGFPSVGLVIAQTATWWNPPASDKLCAVNPRYLAECGELFAATASTMRLAGSPSAWSAHDGIGGMAVVMGLRDP